MAIAIGLPEFYDLGRSVTSIFLLMDHFLYQFSTFSEKMKKIYQLEVRHCFDIVVKHCCAVRDLNMESTEDDFSLELNIFIWIVN